LIHWPSGYYTKPTPKPLHVLWAELEGLVEKGLTKSIGVSNFNTQLLWDLLSYAKIPPVVNQVELNVVCQQKELVRFLLAKNIRPVAYTPVARPGGHAKDESVVPSTYPDASTNEYLVSLAEKYNKSTVQIMLNWGLCKGHAVIPKANSLNHQQDNFNIFDFELTDDEMAGIADLDQLQ